MANGTIEDCHLLKNEIAKLSYYFRTGARSSPTVGACVIGLYSLVITFGALGNLLTVAAVVRNPAMRTNRNYFIVNLALSDFVLCTVTAPITLYTILWTFWTHGEVLCKIAGTLPGFNIFVSTMSIAAIGMDRYIVVIFPTKIERQQKVIVVMSVLVWSMSLGLAAPYFYGTGVLELHNFTECDVYIDICHESTLAWQHMPISREAYTIACILFQYLMPLCALTFIYSQIAGRMRARLLGRPLLSQSTERRKSFQERQRRTNLLLVSIVVVFALSWLPLNTFHILYTFGVIPQFNVPAFAFCHVMGMTSACANPVLYGVLNDNFRTEFESILNRLGVLGVFRGIRTFYQRHKPNRVTQVEEDESSGGALELPARTVPPESILSGHSGKTGSDRARNGVCFAPPPGLGSPTEETPLTNCGPSFAESVMPRGTFSDLVVMVNTI